MQNKKVWFVTGASKGLGLSFVKKLLAAGYRVAATSRSVSDLEKKIGVVPDFLPLAVDLKSDSDVKNAVDKVAARFGRIDVLVNNAGYGLIGSLEEISDEEARENFNVNVFGSLNVIRHTMPWFRKQQSGHIFNISSIGGFTGNFPGFGIYCATKFAVQGFTESLAEEVKAFGIHATVVYPGYFRTNFLDADSLSVPKNEIKEYKTVRDIQAAHQNDIKGNQPGDPDKAVDVIIKTAENINPPLHLFLGADAYQMGKLKLASVEAELEKWKAETLSTAL